MSCSTSRRISNELYALLGIEPPGNELHDLLTMKPTGFPRLQMTPSGPTRKAHLEQMIDDVLDQMNIRTSRLTIWSKAKESSTSMARVPGGTLSLNFEALLLDAFSR